MSALYEWANNNNSLIVDGGEDVDGEVWRLEELVLIFSCP